MPIGPVRYCKILNNVAIALLLTACSGVETRPQDTEKFEAANYTFYGWRTGPLSNSSQSRDPLYVMDPIIRTAVDEILHKKGYRLSPERAEFSINYLYATGMRMGQKGSEASNVSNYPGVIPNRNIDQASIDNAHALGGVKETNNIALQFDDVARKEQVWNVVITKLAEDANRVDTPRLQKNVRSAIKEGLRTLPPAANN
ncbi:MAG: hypothetical protein ACJA09_003760 [Alcanivorax sp.]|jgi:hypothetical protein